jgi:hypothetical protein
MPAHLTNFIGPQTPLQRVHPPCAAAAVPQGADVTSLTLGYVTYRDEGVSWTVVLPPDSRGVASLPFEGELDSLAPSSDPALQLTYIDSPDLDGYDDVLAAGIAAPDLTTTLGPPTAGELRASSTGYAPSDL